MLDKWLEHDAATVRDCIETYIETDDGLVSFLGSVGGQVWTIDGVRLRVPREWLRRWGLDEGAILIRAQRIVGQNRDDLTAMQKSALESVLRDEE